jgi:antitoxin (DNA-binding transcriptional repressor) of toxin-antitoxin stability system
MYHMKTANIRELRHSTTTVLGWVEQGESVQITRRNKVVAVISAPVPETPGKIRLPDYRARLAAIFNDKTLPITGTEIVSYGRGDR